MNKNINKYLKKDEAKFWSKVKKNCDGGCWEWQGLVNGTGRGVMALTTHLKRPVNKVFALGKKNNSKNASVLAHRFSYWLHNGTIDNNLYILHSCDNGLCVNPAHLTQGTQQENMRDMYLRKRSSHQKITLELKELRAKVSTYDLLLKSIVLNLLVQKSKTMPNKSIGEEND